MHGAVHACKRRLSRRDCASVVRLPSAIRNFEGYRGLHPMMRRLCVLLAVPTLCLGCSAGRTVGSRARHDCVNVPVNIGALALPNGHTINVKVGRIIYIELVEPAKYSSPSLPPGFPWQAPASSNPGVLKQESLCATKSLPPGTLPLRVSAFKAMRRGTAQITAPLASAWRALKPSRRHVLRSYEAIVHVQSRPS